MKTKLYLFFLIFPALACGIPAEMNTLSQQAYWACQTATPIPTQQYLIGTAPAPTPESTLTPTATPQWIYGYTTPVPTETPYYLVGSYYYNQRVNINGIAVTLLGHTTKPAPNDPNITYHYFHFELVNDLAQDQYIPLPQLVFIRKIYTPEAQTGTWMYSEEATLANGHPSAYTQAQNPLKPNEVRRTVIGIKAPSGTVNEVGLITNWDRPVKGGLPIWFKLSYDPINCRGSAVKPPPPTPAILKDYYGVAKSGTGNAQSPVSGGSITSYFGCRPTITGIISTICPPGQEFHNGMDIAVPFGSLVHSPVTGIVIYAGQDTTGPDCSDIAGSQPPHKGYGNYVKIQSSTGEIHLLGHLSSINVSAGPVKQGDPIGTVGSTGCSSGAHLHWGCYINGIPTDPLDC